MNYKHHFSLHLPIAKPPWKGLGRRIESMCRKAMYDYQMIEDDSPVAIALSGGKDSLTLLFMLKAILGFGFPTAKLIAIHVAGKYTCGAGVDGNYLKAICKEIDVPLIVRQSEQKLETLECYSCSRKRRSLLFDAAKEEGAKTIAFGHHRDDIAETLLMNMLHKGEFAGMLPKIEMQHYGVTIIRPLAFVSEENVKEFAVQSGFARITCQCPVGQNSMRKKVDRLIDQLEYLYPNARKNIARASLDYSSDKASKP